MSETWYRIAFADEREVRLAVAPGGHLGEAIAVASARLGRDRTVWPVAATVATPGEVPLGESVGKGVVVERFLSPGELVKQAPILKLARLDPLHVEVLAPVSWLGKITMDMQGDVTLASAASGSLTGRVTMVNPLINSASGTFEVLLELSNPLYTIPAGLPCTVRFAIP